MEQAELGTIELAVSESAMRLVRLMVGRPPQTVAGLVRATAVTRTAVTEQLNDLMDAGFVERNQGTADGRGRPRHMYYTTDAALVLLFASNQSLLVPAIWRAITQIGGEKLIRKVRHSVSKQLAQHYKSQIGAKTPARRLRQLTQIMREEGSLVEMETRKDGRVILRKRSCPFISMFEESRAVCGVDREMISDIVGGKVRQVACRHDGDPCCAFELPFLNGK